MYSDDKVLSFTELCKHTTPSVNYLCTFKKGVHFQKATFGSKQVPQATLVFTFDAQPSPSSARLKTRHKETANGLLNQPSTHEHLSFESQIERFVEEHQNGFVVSSNDFLQSLCARGHVDKALLVLNHFSSFTPSISSYLSLLQACIKSKSLPHVKQIYAHISSNKVNLNGMLGDYLAMALARCGDIEDAHQVANSLPHLTVFSWTAIISAYAEQGLGQEALALHHNMLDQGVYPDKYTFVSLFEACSSLTDLTWGRELHAEACMKGFILDVVVNNSLVTMYGKQGAILDAAKMFEVMSHRNIVSWNAMLSVYVEQEHAEKALLLYRQMQEEGLNSNQQTFVIALQACNLLAEKEEACLMEGMAIKMKALSIGEALHSDAQMKDFTLDLYVGTALSTMYGKCGVINRAENLFSRLHQRSIISWNSMLSAFVGQRQGMKALQLYKYLHEEGVLPDKLTVVFALQACGIVAEDEGALDESIKQVVLEIGQALHVDSCIKGFELDAYVGTALLGMYSKCGCISSAENVFGDFLELNIVSWSAMLAAYIEQGLGQKALILYRQMVEEGMCYSVQTLMLAIQASGTLADNEEVFTEQKCSNQMVSLEVGHALHAYACKTALDSDVLVSSALVSMYGKCGSILEADYVFKAMAHPDVVAYTALLYAYVSEGYPEQVLAVYKEMPKKHLILDEVMVICFLQACGETGSLEVCKELHFIVVAAGYDKISSVMVALVHAYGNCASMVDGQAAFDELCKPDVMPWTACIMGHAGEGNIEASLNMLEQLNLAGVICDEITISSALLACGHVGDIAKAIEYFTSMREDHGIIPQSKHHAIMVELLGRAGDFGRIDDLLSEMHVEADDTSIWMCLMGALCAHNHVELAREAFNQILSMQPNQTSAYILMSNTYADHVL